MWIIKRCGTVTELLFSGPIQFGKSSLVYFAYLWLLTLTVRAQRSVQVKKIIILRNFLEEKYHHQVVISNTNYLFEISQTFWFFFFTENETKYNYFFVSVNYMYMTGKWLLVVVLPGSRIGIKILWLSLYTWGGNSTHFKRNTIRTGWDGWLADWMTDCCWLYSQHIYNFTTQISINEDQQLPANKNEKSCTERNVWIIGLGFLSHLVAVGQILCKKLIGN